MLLKTLRHLIRVGQLTLIDARGTVHVFGRSRSPPSSFVPGRTAQAGANSREPA